jgi:hypothetical protein
MALGGIDRDEFKMLVTQRVYEAQQERLTSEEFYRQVESWINRVRQNDVERMSEIVRDGNADTLVMPRIDSSFTVHDEYVGIGGIRFGFVG